MLLHAGDKVLDRIVTAAEERRVLFPERLQAAVWADQHSEGRRGDHLAPKRGAKGYEAVGLLKDVGCLAEVDPGQKL